MDARLRGHDEVKGGTFVVPSRPPCPTAMEPVGTRWPQERNTVRPRPFIWPCVPGRGNFENARPATAARHPLRPPPCSGAVDRAEAGGSDGPSGALRWPLFLYS